MLVSTPGTTWDPSAWLVKRDWTVSLPVRVADLPCGPGCVNPGPPIYRYRADPSSARTTTRAGAAPTATRPSLQKLERQPQRTLATLGQPGGAGRLQAGPRGSRQPTRRIGWFGDGEVRQTAHGQLEGTAPT